VRAAAQKGHSNVVRLLIEKGADLLTPGLIREKVLEEAAMNGHEETVKVLLEARRWTNGRTFALIFAARHGEIGVYKLLAEYGAVDSVPWRSLVFVAGSNGHAGMVAHILREAPEGASIGEFWKYGSIGVEIVDALLARGVSLAPDVRFGRTPLHWVASGNNVNPWRGPCDPRSIMRLTQVCDVNHPDHGGNTALHWACCAGWGQGVRHLLMAGASSTAPDEAGRLPIQRGMGNRSVMAAFAWWKGEQEKARLLREAREDEKVEIVMSHRKRKRAWQNDEVDAVLRHVVQRLNDGLFEELVRSLEYEGW
jgi:hypothetical protein